MIEPRDPVEPDTADDAASDDVLPGEGDIEPARDGLEHPARRSRRGGRLGRAAAKGLLAILIAAAVFGLWVGVLWLTTPGPEDSPGWERLADMPSARGEVASAATDDQLWVLGGLSGMGRTSRTVDVYDVGSDEWRPGPDLPSGRHHAAAAILDGAVHVSGGASRTTDWTPRDQLWALAPGSATWKELEPMPEGRLGHDMVAIESRLYVVGGVGDSSDVFVFDPDTGWERGAPLGSTPDHVRAVALDGEVWLIGGRTDGLEDHVWIYDPDSDRWREGPRLPFGMSATAVGVLDGAIHVVGGEDPDLFGGKVHDRHVVLAPGAERWEQATDPLLAVHGAGYGTVDGALIIAGGASRQGVLSTLAWTAVTQRVS